MTSPRFHWHARARVFTAAGEVQPRVCPPAPHIPAAPPEAAVQALQTTMGHRAFCVSDTRLPLPVDLPADTLVTLTGGTSGAPKAIARSHASWIRSFETNAQLFGYNAADSIAVTGTLAHSLALYGLIEGVHLGLPVHITAAGDSAHLQRARSTILYATPTQLRLLRRDTRLPDIRLILCGGGALNTATRAHIRAICPDAALHVFYGAAETSFVTLGDAQTPEGSVGRPYPQVEIDLRDTDAAGTGTLWLRSPYLFDRYIAGESRHTQQSGGWLTVGELGWQDAQGNIFLRGRAGRVFTVADQTVYPEELEAQIGALEGVRHCAVLARPDTLRGQHLIAVLDGAEDAILRARVLTHCKAAAFHVPRDVLFLDPFPLLPSGKPDLQTIAARCGASA